MDIVQLSEIGMLVAFGCSWPFNILKSWRSRTAKGKSVVFEFIVVFGYLLGLVHQAAQHHHRQTCETCRTYLEETAE